MDSLGPPNPPQPYRNSARGGLFGCCQESGRPVESFQDDHRPERDHLARPTGLLDGERGRCALRVLRVPFRHRPLEVRMHRVEVPSPIAPLLLPELRDCVPQPAIVAESEGGYEIEAYEQVVVVVHGVVEAVPRFVGSSLPVKLALEEEFRAELDGTLHPFRPFLPRVDGEGAQALPRVQVPTAPEAAPPSFL